MRYDEHSRFDKTLFFTIYSITLILFHLSNTSDITKQKCIFKSLLLGVLCANFGHFLSPGELFLRVSYLKPERSRNISRKMFNLVTVDISVIQPKYSKSLLTSIAIFQCRKMLTWPWSLNHLKMFISY